MASNVQRIVSLKELFIYLDRHHIGSRRLNRDALLLFYSVPYIIICLRTHVLKNWHHYNLSKTSCSQELISLSYFVKKNRPWKSSSHIFTEGLKTLLNSAGLYFPERAAPERTSVASVHSIKCFDFPKI